MDPKELAALIQGAVDELHKATDRQDAEIKSHGAISGETKATVEKINTEITARLDEMEAKYQRATVPAPGSPDAQSEEQKARTAAFFKYVRSGRAELNPEERKALVEDTTGLYLVTPELDTEIVRTLPKINVVRGLATVRTISKNSL